jgi:phosphoglycolate phosphatase-like HAD superfamily hydrolase
LKHRYIENENTLGNKYFIRDDKLQDIIDIDVIVFDCDGVLLDVRESYSSTVARVSSIIFEAMTGLKVEETLFDSDLNHVYKRTGGFNNDWSLSYAIIMRMLAELPIKHLSELNKIAKASLDYKTPYERFSFLKKKRAYVKIPLETLYEKLYKFASELDSTGVKSVDNRLLAEVGINIKKALNPRKVGENIIPTMFEEIFEGKSLFQKNFGIRAEFTTNEQGLIEKEKVVVTKDTFERLTALLGGNRIGIASGSPSGTARYVLGNIVDIIPENAQIWYDTIEEAQSLEGKKNLHKPHPYSLLKSSKAFWPYKNVLYVGDTMADLIMTRNTRKQRFLFAGVYRNVENSEKVKNDFLKKGSDIVIPTVNDLPSIFTINGGEND